MKKRERWALEERCSNCMRKMFFNKSAHVSVFSSYLWFTLPKHIFALLLIRKRIKRKFQFSSLFLFLYEYMYFDEATDATRNMRQNKHLIWPIEHFSNILKLFLIFLRIRCRNKFLFYYKNSIIKIIEKYKIYLFVLPKLIR